MSRWTLRFLHICALFGVLHAGSAEAGVGGLSGGALSLVGPFIVRPNSPDGGDCWYDNGSNGPGYYPCGDEWNNGFGGAAPIIGPAIRRHHRHGVIVARPQAQNPIYPGAPSRRPALAFGPPVCAAAPALPPSAVVRGFLNLAPARRSYVARSPRRPRGRLPRVCQGQFSSVSWRRPRSSPHRRASVARFCGGGGLHGLGGATGVHIGAPASPGFAGVGSFHAGGAVGAAHIGAPASPGFTGGGSHGRRRGRSFRSAAARGSDKAASDIAKRREYPSASRSMSLS